MQILISTLLSDIPKTENFHKVIPRMFAMELMNEFIN